MSYDPVIKRAKEVLACEKPWYGFSDVGDALINYLRGEWSVAETLQFLEDLEIDYTRKQVEG